MNPSKFFRHAGSSSDEVAPTLAHLASQIDIQNGSRISRERQISRENSRPEEEGLGVWDWGTLEMPAVAFDDAPDEWYVKS